MPSETDYFAVRFSLPVNSRPPARCFVFGNVRVSVLTDRLVRVEHSPGGAFTDAPTQVVWNRDFARPECRAEKRGARLLIETPARSFCLSARSGRLLSAAEKPSGKRLTPRGNLLGTRRTLDATFGRVKLKDGLIALGGLTVLDDSASLLLDGQSRILPRPARESDRYYFAYGSDYRAALRDFFRLTGPVPLVPRWALGNWWSRYKAYSQAEYLGLIDRFRREGIPLTVATVDMDWHWVNLERFGEDARQRRGRKLLWSSGWTGYSWNTELFPDYQEFLRTLRETYGLKVTLNLHPSDGVRPFEDAYPAMAAAMGMDPASRQPVEFDLTDPAFVEQYFRVLHHPYEDEGVDFWWIDWQQGRRSKLPGLDPLWALNHYHYYDSARRGQRPLILSRYAGPGSHRYPLGFSGDTAINWKVLRFQPAFTATAANAGYGWWSHDIGGHHFGRKDDELYLRWLQFGVFNPILRLHSTSNEFAGKEPWKCGPAAERLAGDLLRLRHRLIPYLYSMAVRAHREGAALCEPLYYQYPDAPEARRYRGSYFFGSELLCAPITEKTDPVTSRAGVTLWLPPGRWTDIFTDQIYKGGRILTLFRPLDRIPVLAKAGAILPTAPGPGWEAPGELRVDLWRGNNTFTLCEDDGGAAAAPAETTFTLREEGDTLRLTVAPGSPALLPDRIYRLTFRDLSGWQNADLRLDGQPRAPEWDGACFLLRGLAPGAAAELTLTGIRARRNPALRESLVDLISSFQMGTNRKRIRYTAFLDRPHGKIPGPRRAREPIRELLEQP
ncbi:MAG: glycoside hydrolase family 31 protein [Oscillospiraceae bacterium]|jgi:hypothetical protein|nr:glycoside hydrolase family 31 protein [Oscillospiraceae bacterium]